MSSTTLAKAAERHQIVFAEDGSQGNSSFLSESGLPDPDVGRPSIVNYQSCDALVARQHVRSCDGRSEQL
jgi:hypothetical protein